MTSSRPSSRSKADLVAVHGEAKAIDARQPDAEELADPVASGRDEVLHRKRREDVKERKLPSRTTAGRPNTGRPFPLWAWYGPMAFMGLGFGLMAERRPFGEGVLLHPLMLFFVAVGIALLALRVALKRPVPEVIPDRALMRGCALGLAMFLAGNFLASHFLQQG